MSVLSFIEYKMTKKLFVYATLSTFVVVFCIIVIQFKFGDNFRNGAAINTLPKKGLNIKTILYFKTMFDRPDFYFGKTGFQLFENCTYSNCFATDQKRLLSIENFDALVFHGYDYSILGDGKPENRSASQYYIFGNLESPQTSYPVYKLAKNFYNLTMTYRSDSDIYRPYGYFEKTKTDYKLPPISDFYKKKKKIAWMVSKCNTAGKRNLLAKGLSHFIQLDIYGECGNINCPRKDDYYCRKMIEENYKFYLSFENSVCEDYVTEKLFAMLQFNIIPIVYGGANYSKIAPPHSVINVMDFQSVENLVKYLVYLDNNPNEYLKYFEWKKNYVVYSTITLGACRLCEVLNNPIKKTYEDMGEWYAGKHDEKCSTTFIEKFLRM